MDRHFINAVFRAYVLKLEVEGIKEPLTRVVRVCDIWCAIAAMLNAEPPQDVLEAVKKGVGE